MPFVCKKSQNSETLKKTIAAHNPPHQHDRHLHRLQVQLGDKEEQGGVAGAAAGVAGCNSASLATLDACRFLGSVLMYLSTPKVHRLTSSVITNAQVLPV